MWLDEGNFKRRVESLALDTRTVEASAGAIANDRCNKATHEINLADDMVPPVSHVDEVAFGI